MSNGNLQTQQLLNTLFAQRLGYQNRLQEYALADEERRRMREQELAQSVGQGLEQASKLAMMRKQEQMQEAGAKGRSAAIIEGLGGKQPQLEALGLELPEDAMSQEQMLSGAMSGAAEVAKLQAQFEQKRNIEAAKMKMRSEAPAEEALEEQRLASADLSRQRAELLKGAYSAYLGAKTAKEKNEARQAAIELEFQLRNEGMRPGDAARIFQGVLMSPNIMSPKPVQEITERSMQMLPKPADAAPQATASDQPPPAFYLEHKDAPEVVVKGLWKSLSPLAKQKYLGQ